MFWRRLKTDPHEYSMDTWHPVVASPAALLHKRVRWWWKYWIITTHWDNLLKAWSNSFNGFLHFWTTRTWASVHSVNLCFFLIAYYEMKKNNWHELLHNQEWLEKTNQKGEGGVKIFDDPNLEPSLFLQRCHGPDSDGSVSAADEEPEYLL